MRTFTPIPVSPARRQNQRGSMLLELLIAMVVLTIGLGGLLVLLMASMYTNSNARTDTTSTMLAEHVIEQISSQQANSITPLAVSDCAGGSWAVQTVGAAVGAGNSGTNGGNGATLTANGTIDWTQSYSSVPGGYAMRYIGCGANGSQAVYDVRWNVVSMGSYSRMILISARPTNSGAVGGLRYIVPVNLRTIGGM